MPRAFITGITGQDGSYLAEFLLEKGYEVHGLVHQKAGEQSKAVPGGTESSASSTSGAMLRAPAILHPGDLRDPESIRRALNESTPDEVYHLAAQTHVGLSFEQVEATCELTAMGTLRILEMVRKQGRPAKFFHPSSSEVFGRPEASPQDEQTPFRPVTPYGCAKAFATQLVSLYRQTYGLFACNGICYNHESPRRGHNFVTQKICRAAAAIKEGRQNELMLGSLTARRDWGDARDYVRGMWLALQHSEPEDFVFATGELHSVQEVVELAFGAVGLDWRKYLKQDPKLLRPEEPARLIGNASKAARLLGWKPQRSFQELIAEMTREGLRSE